MSKPMRKHHKKTAARHGHAIPRHRAQRKTHHRNVTPRETLAVKPGPITGVDFAGAEGAGNIVEIVEIEVIDPGENPFEDEMLEAEEEE